MHILELKDSVVIGTKQRSHEWWRVSREGFRKSLGMIIAGSIIVGLAFLALADFPELAGGTKNALFGAWLLAWMMLGGWALDCVVQLFMANWPEYELGKVINTLLRTALAFVLFSMLVFYLGTVSLHYGMSSEMNGAALVFGAVISLAPAVLIESRKAKRRHERSLLEKKNAELQRQFDDLADYVRRLD